MKTETGTCSLMYVPVLCDSQIMTYHRPRLYDAVIGGRHRGRHLAIRPFPTLFIPAGIFSTLIVATKV